MSSYIYFFAHKNGVFVPIGHYGRSTEIYSVFNEMAAWEQIRPLTRHELKCAKDSLRTEEFYTQRIEELRARIGYINTFNNTIEEKLRAIEEVEEEIDELREDRKEVRNARAFIGFMYDILDEAEYIESADMDPDDCIFIGLECGSNVSAADIQKN